MDDKLKELYGQLYDDTMKIKLSNFFPICGSEYSRENSVRLMAIGRAVDGWDEFNASSKDEFLKSAERSMESRGFSWLGHTDPAGNYDDELASESYLNRSGNEVHYNLRTSPFWRTVKEITQHLNGWDENTIPSRWYEYRLEQFVCNFSQGWWKS